MDGRTGGGMRGQVGAWMSGGWMDGWMRQKMDGQMVGRTDR